MTLYGRAWNPPQIWQRDAPAQPPPLAHTERAFVCTGRHQQNRLEGVGWNPEQTHAAEQRGAAITLATAVEFAVTLTTTGAQRPRPLPERGYLTLRERELLTLVA